MAAVSVKGMEPPPAHSLILEEISKGFTTSEQDNKVLQRIFERIDFKKDNKIDREELEHVLKSLGYDPVKVNQYGISEVEQMIWEVDEDGDGCVNAEEFNLMFDRGRNDKTGHEPKKLFNLCQFMCLDRDGDGSISSEECMEMIMHRFGRERLDEVFRNDPSEREITLSDFLAQVNRSHHSGPKESGAKGGRGGSAKMPSIKGRR
mmetsp:Transcript_59054/g.139522  ORF Transcript_59054/g.139522 Transcript_59054/m.139522 type:complete len:205 (+) Transcript_59054:76-690(+)